MPKKKRTLKSATTPGHRMQLRSWLAELVMLRSNRGKLPPYFWRDTKWKWKYTNEVKAISKFIRNYGEFLVVKTICDNRGINSFTSYGDIEFLIQREAESRAKLGSVKDRGPVECEARESDVDLREPRFSFPKKGFFEKLSELEDDNVSR